MSARRVQLKTEYTQREKDAHSEFCQANIEYSGILSELIDMYTPIGFPYHWSDYRSLRRVEFMVHQYENCGATFGFLLILRKPIGDEYWNYELKTYLESGYQDGNIVVEGGLRDIEKVLQGFAPVRYEQG